MIHDEPFPYKKVGLSIIMIVYGLISAYFLFIAIISIWTGLSHAEQDGFWMPILTGTIAIIVIVWVYLRLSRFIRNFTKEKDLIGA